MSALQIVVFVFSALFAWSMGSHYSGAVMGAAYGSGVISLRTALLLGAALALIGSVTASVNVIDTYAHGLVRTAPTVCIAAALLASAVVSTISTYFKLPTSTIQICTFSLLGAARRGWVGSRCTAPGWGSSSPAGSPVRWSRWGWGTCSAGSCHESSTAGNGCWPGR